MGNFATEPLTPSCKYNLIKYSNSDTVCLLFERKKTPPKVDLLF